MGIEERLAALDVFAPVLVRITLCFHLMYSSPGLRYAPLKCL
jgi:hypothetical protein